MSVRTLLPRLLTEFCVLWLIGHVLWGDRPVGRERVYALVVFWVWMVAVVCGVVVTLEHAMRP